MIIYNIFRIIHQDILHVQLQQVLEQLKTLLKNTILQLLIILQIIQILLIK